ncbi:MAG: class B sortase [Oscillospiraceae bacterium]|nr:class B sortase [Oscillospiraceae bacterium]
MMRKISIILSLLLSAALAVAVFKIVQTINIQQKEKEDFQIIAELVNTPTIPDETVSAEETDEKKSETESTRNIAPVLEQNADCIGWIFIDGTNINYPVMHTPDNPQKYLRLSFEKKYSQSGVPFLDGRCSLQDGNLIIYGHNMKNGTMFSDLKKYLDTDFREAHKTIEFQTADGVFLFEVNDVIRTNISDERYNQINSTDGRILALSTCYGSAKSDRLLIIAKEVTT